MKKNNNKVYKFLSKINFFTKKKSNKTSKKKIKKKKNLKDFNYTMF